VPDPEDNADDETTDSLAWDAFFVKGTSLVTRTQRFRIARLGGWFEWRYAGRSERKAAGSNINSLLVLDRITKVAVVGGREEEVRTPVAWFVRGADTRTPGSSGSSAGNGGRLMIDVHEWETDDTSKRGREENTEMVVITVVTTAIMMLKKEVDRRRTHQFMVMAAASGGGH
jgi:hypothetical protein